MKKLWVKKVKKTISSLVVKEIILVFPIAPDNNRSCQKCVSLEVISYENIPNVVTLDIGSPNLSLIILLL